MIRTLPARLRLGATAAVLTTAVGVATAAALTGGASAGAATPGASPSQSKTNAVNSAVTNVSPGVQVWTQTWRTANGTTEYSSLMKVDLTNKHVDVDTVSAHGVINGGYLPVHDMILDSGAVAGINGDFFDLGTSTGVTYGGIVHSGVIWKTPHYGFQANFYIRSNGTAGIGALGFGGTVAVGTKIHYPLHSVNSIADAANGYITEITPHMAGTHVPAGCAVAVASKSTHGTVRITKVISSAPRSYRLAQLAPTGTGLVGCGTAAKWMRKSLKVKDAATVSMAFSGGSLDTLIDGAEVLLQKGKNVYDSTGHDIQGHNAETFVCVSKDEKHLLMGTVDDRGGWWGGGGVTMSQLRSYLKLQGCYSAMALDGGGSSTLDYRYPGSSSVVTVNQPADGSERWIPDSLLVFAQ